MRSGLRRTAPRFFSGYLEGYYGRLLSFSERAGVLDRLQAIGANRYFYAPKEDPFHRRDWRSDYPEAWCKKFAAFVAVARLRGVTVVAALAPGLSYRYLSDDDFRTLERKFRAFIRMGCDEAALLMDDISTELPHADAASFRTLGHAHGVLLQRLRQRLCGRGGLCRLWFCPTVYSDYFAASGVKNDPYLRDLAASLPADVPVLWTGPAIVVKRLAPADVKQVAKILGRKPVLWDNFYAHDYCPGKIFLGPFRDRPKTLRQAAAGLLLNPTGLYHTDLFLLDLLGGFLRGRAAPQVWARALKSHGVPAEFQWIAALLASPFDTRLPAAAAVPRWRAALKPLLWEWKSPLQREWYPYLYALDADLRLLEGGDARPDAAWVRKKYSPVIAHLLLDFAEKRGNAAV